MRTHHFASDPHVLAMAVVSRVLDVEAMKSVAKFGRSFENRQEVRLAAGAAWPVHGCESSEGSPPREHDHATTSFAHIAPTKTNILSFTLSTRLARLILSATTGTAPQRRAQARTTDIMASSLQKQGKMVS